MDTLALSWPCTARRRHLARTAAVWHNRLANTAIAVLAVVLLALLAARASHTPVGSAPARPALAALRPRPVTPAHPAAPEARPAGHRPATATRSLKIHPGDTLWGLAHHYSTSVEDLQHLNHLATSTLIYAGDHLTLPAARPSFSPSSPAKRTAVTAPTETAAPVAADTHHAGHAAVGFARGRLGTPYTWGGTGDGGYDCSGLIQAAWRAAGVDLPRTTYAQAHSGTRITRDQLQPGDLVFTNHFCHVQLYTGDGHVIVAAHTGTRVRYAPLPRPDAATAYVHIPAPHAQTTAAAPPADSLAAPGSPERIAQRIFGDQYPCAAAIITRECGWSPTATHPTSGAYGLAQALPGAKMARFGSDWHSNPLTQLRWMHAYVHSRYGSACAAWAFWQTHRWY